MLYDVLCCRNDLTGRSGGLDCLANIVLCSSHADRSHGFSNVQESPYLETAGGIISIDYFSRASRTQLAVEAHNSKEGTSL